MSEPIARGVIVVLAGSRAETLTVLGKESASILRALRTQAEVLAEPCVPTETDFVLLLVDETSDVDTLRLPDLKDRAAVVAGVSDDIARCRALIARARRRLRDQGAALGARELVFSPTDFGYLGLESDGLREKLEILLTALVTDGERLKLRREGWEEPTES